MLSPTNSACLLIADLSGYTRYLAGVELNHAQDILADLMGTVARVVRPTFHLYKLEGDAMFFYAITDAVDGSILLDVIEGSYVAFQQRLESIRAASTCECRACERIGDLDVKVVAHHGEVLLQELLGQVELLGTAVIVAHRMLKNQIVQPAYLFITDDCVAAAGLHPDELGWHRHEEAYEELGSVSGWVHDLAEASRSYFDRTSARVSADEATLSFTTFFAAPPQMVWEHISSADLRPQWSHGIDRVIQMDPSGRRRAGTINHCMHGDDLLLQEFIDWKPPRYFTSKVTMPNGVELISTHEVEPAEGGALVHDNFAEPTTEEGRATMEQMRPMLEEGFTVEAAKLAEILSEAVVSAAVPEPELPEPNEAARAATAVLS